MIDAGQVARLLRNARSIVLILHRQPDGDAVGSAVALVHALGSRRTKIVCISPIAPVFTEALGAVKTETFLTANAELYVVLDCPDLKRTGYDESLQKISKRRSVVVIDHHQRGNIASIAGEYYFCDRQASSTCELVATIIDELRVPVSGEIATALLLGVHTDTGGFQHPNTTSITLNLAAKLIRLGADFNRVRALFGPRRDIRKLQLWGHILSSVSINSMGIAVARVSKAILEQSGADAEDLSGLAKYLCSIEGTKAALVLVETNRGWRGSLRAANRTFNVGQLAKLLGGSGGKKVAGFLATDELVSGTMLQNPRVSAPKRVEIEEI